jgi:DNA-binding transcriptional regulator YiaG
MFTVELPDVKAIREALHMSQQRFAENLPHSAADTEKLGAGPPLAGAPAAHLQAISRAPQMIKEALQHG